MTLDTMIALCATLTDDRASAAVVFGPEERVAIPAAVYRGAVVRARFETRRSARVVFSGGKHGTRSLDVYCSTPERVLAHWSGYVAAIGGAS